MPEPMQVDFYQLGSETVEAMLPPLASKCLATGENLLVVAEDTALRARLSNTLWRHAREGFLANGEAGGPHDARQPILLSAGVTPANAARMVAFADGVWRDIDTALITRAFLFFDDGTLMGARATWKALASREDVQKRFWRREDGRWVVGP